MLYITSSSSSLPFHPHYTPSAGLFYPSRHFSSTRTLVFANSLSPVTIGPRFPLGTPEPAEFHLPSFCAPQDVHHDRTAKGPLGDRPSQTKQNWSRTNNVLIPFLRLLLLLRPCSHPACPPPSLPLLVMVCCSSGCVCRADVEVLRRRGLL